MRKFKTFFYGLYLLFFAFTTFIAFFYEDLVLMWDWDPITTWTGLIRFVLKLGGIGTALFLIEIIVENIHLYTKNRKIRSLEQEVLDIKAKLYDLSQSELPVEPTVTPSIQEETPDEPEVEEQHDEREN